jgi:hypothetical protein
MSSSSTTKTRTEPFIRPWTAPADIGQQTEQSEIVRTKGEKGNGFDGLVRH